MKISIMAALAALVLAGCTTSPEMPAFRKMLVVGDALTACAPDASLGWPNDWGMAATARENDFAHRLHAALRKGSPDLELATDSIMYQDEMTGWVHLVPCSADLVVIQLGENYRGGISLDEYGEAYGQMIDELREGSPKTVVCLGPWENVQLEEVIAKAAAAHGAKFVSLRAIHADPENRAASEGKFPKIGGMPGDRGMEKIAEAVLKSLGQ